MKLTKTEEKILTELKYTTRINRNGRKIIEYNGARFLDAALKLQDKGLVIVQWRLTNPETHNFNECRVTLND